MIDEPFDDKITWWLSRSRKVKVWYYVMLLEVDKPCHEDRVWDVKCLTSKKVKALVWCNVRNEPCSYNYISMKEHVSDVLMKYETS